MIIASLPGVRNEVEQRTEAFYSLSACNTTRIIHGSVHIIQSKERVMRRKQTSKGEFNERFAFLLSFTILQFTFTV